MNPSLTGVAARAISPQWFLITLLALIVPNVSAQNATFTRTDYAFVGNNHIASDLNGDGILDLAGTGAASAMVMLGNGDGSFRPKIEFPVGGSAQDLASGDFNSDGRIDLVVSLNDPNFSLTLLTGRGDGTFNAGVNFANTSGLDSRAVVATDLDNDGRLDVVLAHSIACFTAPCTTGRSISVLLGFGDGTFQQPWEVQVGTGMSRIAVGDFNRDGIKDLSIAGDQSQLFVLLGVGNGTFLQQPTRTLTPDTFGVDGTDIDVADLNGDTIEDLIVAIPLNGSRTAVLLGNGDGTFRDPSIITEPRLRIPQFQVVADFNRDGFQDLAISLGWGTEGYMEILHGNGDGTFRPPVLYLVPSTNTSNGGGTLVTGDFNRDGRPDIGLPIIGAGPSLAVLVNSTVVVTSPPAFGSFTANPSTVTGGTPSELTITLAAGSVAPSGGLTFSASSGKTSVVTVPGSVSIPAGGTRVTFTATTRTVTSSQDVRITVSNNQLGSRRLTLRVTPSSTPPPPPPPAPVTLSAVSLSPSTVTGGNSAQGVVTLSGQASSATTVTLSSSNSIAGVPASVTVPAGASSASFTVTTTPVSIATSTTITAVLAGTSRSATLGINPAAAPPPTSDTVSITRAEYEASRRTLRVEATSTRSDATLQVFVTSSGELLGTLANRGGGRYEGELTVATNPQNITVRSNRGGVATRNVVLK